MRKNSWDKGEKKRHYLFVMLLFGFGLVLFQCKCYLGLRVIAIIVSNGDTMRNVVIAATLTAIGR